MHAVDQLTTTLREHGLKVTAQRLTIFGVMRRHGQHLTAEEVFARVRAVLPTISLTTVYKVLNELVALGELQRVVLGDGSARFDPNTSQHAHLVCLQCGQAEDLPSTDYHVGLPEVAARGYRVLRQAVIFYGVCPACQANP
jgi:Fe2+ or Zn2+ uptake regulation protein